ncbi:MAG: glycosyltransferase family 2 protein [Verrucomicrobiota bacterium]|nr:glycosyltransferase family 2 protein [Verrucomicrobiota bacterium]
MIVCAIVVTHNRRELLREALIALLAQTAPVAQIIVIDNASSDGTDAMLREEFGQLQLLRLAENVGGAGGFHEGMRIAADGAEDWLWLLDDDTIARSDALEQLLAAWTRFPEEMKPEMLTSVARWSDDTMHPMNVPHFRHDDAWFDYSAAERGTMSIRTATFVSLLVRRRAVAEFGLPMADYFIWRDDIEWTGRVLKTKRGVLVPTSIVIHKTKTKYGPAQGSADRCYYFVRNGVWMHVRSSAFARNELTNLWGVFLHEIVNFLRCTKERWAGLRAITRGFVDGILTRPQR